MIENLLLEHEGKTLEFKETTRSLTGIIKTIIAFANTAGGTLVIGIRDGSREVVGLADSLLEEERLANAVADSVSPLLMPDIEICSFQNKELLVVRVPHSIGPYYFKSEGSDKGLYVRFGSTNRTADAEMAAALRLLASNVSYDELPHPRGKIDDKVIKDVFSWVKKRPTEQTYETLGIFTRRSGKLCVSNGGVLLFDTNRLELFPDSLIRCGRFSGSTKEKILDQTDIQAPLPHAIDSIIAFIERNIRTEAKIGRMQREDILEYPPYAIREAVINSILHADYAMKGSHIQIAIFDDRIEFSNPGGLPFGQTIEKALSGASRLRNRVIGRVFRELKLIEQWGSGLQRILATCKRQGLKTPVIEELNNHFRLTLYSTQVEEVELEPWGKLLMKRLKEEGALKTKDAARVWKVSTRTARLRLKTLVDEGFIFRLGTSDTDPTVSYIANKKF